VIKSARQRARKAHIRQSNGHSCGAASLRIVFRWFGHEHSEQSISRAAQTTASGTTPLKIAGVALRAGFNVSIQKEMNVEQLKDATDSGRLAIVAIQAWPNGKPEKIDWTTNWEDGHYVVVFAVDGKKVHIIDPATDEKVLYIDREEFEERWHDVDKFKRRWNHLGIAVGETEDEI
jgi:ABC-type bacteriocin/lantibiotic exporter with double-glycine peptidase domain